MITLYAFKKIFPEGIGETKDMRVQWALEEIGLPYRVHGLDHSAGDLDAAAYTQINPFHQVPSLDDDGFVITESAAIVLYLAEKAGKLIPSDAQGRMRVTQWCFAAVSTVAPTLMCMDMMSMFDSEKRATKMHEEVPKIAARWFAGLEHRLDGREWIACAEFTVADILMACVLRDLRKTDQLKPHPKTQAYYERCIARPAWERTLQLYADRLGVTVESIR
ncbi:MAG: glutathione S-transferase family protein [Kofleriaceae bacterium]